ncbi:hypothetical protein F5Y09DRAFT_314633 [Xylaria sp. FL1042]|nr:hypothetical protein F5Y09DRAFT_314633 [Xylaria sp. FL1042]
MSLMTTLAHDANRHPNIISLSFFLLSALLSRPRYHHRDVTPGKVFSVRRLCPHSDYPACMPKGAASMYFFKRLATRSLILLMLSKETQRESPRGKERVDRTYRIETLTDAGRKFENWLARPRLLLRILPPQHERTPAYRSQLRYPAVLPDP